MNQRIRVLIAEDDALVRDALVDLVRSDPELEVAGVATDTQRTIQVCCETRPDVALIDVKMPGGGGVAAVERISERCRSTRVIALSAYDDRQTILAMLRAGAIGYMVKGTPPTQILAAIRHAMQGQAILSRDVTADVIQEFVKQIERSERLAARLADSDRAKAELLQVLSHELRTPVSVIEGFAGFVADRFDDLSRAKMRELAEPLHRATARIVRLAGNIAAAVAYGGDATRSRPRPFAADQILSDVVDEFPQHRMRLRLPGDVAPDARLWADPPMAVRALVIVVENAFDFSPPEAPVELEIRAGGDSFEFRVSDRGPGVDPVFRDRMFEPFAQADMSETRRRPGLGVGLYLASRIMETHEGSITYEDRPGGGATFVLRFPAPLDDGADQTAIPGLGPGAGFPASGTEAKGVHAA